MSPLLNEAAMSSANALFFLAYTALLGIAYGSGCSSVFIGQETADVIRLAEQYVPRGQRDDVIAIPDACKMHGKLLVGEGATVCDYITAPDISLGPAFSPLTIHRTNELNDSAKVNIVQHCQGNRVNSNMSI